MALYRNVRLIFEEPVTPDAVRDDIIRRLAAVGRDVQHVTSSTQGANIVTVGVFIEDSDDGLNADVQTALHDLEGFRGCPPFVSTGTRGTSMG